MSDPTASPQELKPSWQPLSRVDRRVIGVLIEKGKTTPDAYPLTLNALTNGCNQKSNRSPQMQLTADEIEESLERLRHMGAAAEVFGSGRVPKYKHYMYDWLGVDKVEIAVMAELLLRGEQTVGELRSRAARMEPIADVGALRPVLASLMEKGLVVSLTPEGRGQIVTHALYTADEMQRFAQKHGGVTSAPTASPPASSPVAAADEPSGVKPIERPAETNPPSEALPESEVLAEMRSQIADLRAEVGRLKKEVEDLWSNVG